MSYWTIGLNQRVSRRRAITVAGGGAGAALFLAACGGSKSSGSSKEPTLLAQPADTTQAAKRGGVMKDRHPLSDPSTLDIFAANNPLNPIANQTYSTLVQFKPGLLKPSENEIAPDIAESWETSPDGLQITMKVRQGVKWHNKSPVNGRAMDMDDVLFSWDRFVKRGSSRSSVANSVSPGAPVVSLTATDSRTLVMKLKEPLVYVLGLFASNSSGNMLILPKETDTTFDPRGDVIGTGPFMMSNYTPSVGFTLKRNPDFYDKDYALVDEVSLPFVSEYAAALSQFKAGNTYSMGSYLPNAYGVTALDVVAIKQEQPKIDVYQGPLAPPANTNRLFAFGWLPAGKSPFMDERVRQAISMSWDRDLHTETFANVSSFASKGLPVATSWPTALAPTYEGWWLDPQGKDFGPNGKYFKHDLAEAKKLLSAAGFPRGFETVSNYVTSQEFATDKDAEVIDGFIAELGITIKKRILDYTKEYIPSFRDGNGQYEGWSYISAAGAQTGGSAVGALANEFWSKGGATFRGFSSNGQNDKSGDPQVDDLLQKARVQPDTEKRKALIFDLQRYLAKAMYGLQQPGFASGFLMAWPCIGNYNAFQGSRPNSHLWVDQTKAPIAKS